MKMKTCTSYVNVVTTFCLRCPVKSSAYFVMRKYFLGADLEYSIDKDGLITILNIRL